MSRRLDPDFDLRIAEWLETDPNTAPPELLRTVDGALPSIAQRRVLHLPWRTLPMNRLALLGTALATVAVIGVLAVTLGARTPAPQVAASTAPSAPQASPSPVASASAAASSAADLTASYVAARDQVCATAMAAKAPLATRYDVLWDNGITAAQRTDAVAALRDFLALNDSVNTQLDALTPPPDLLHDHIIDVAQRQDLSTLIAYELSLIDAGKLADAQAVDISTDRISEQARAYERHNGLGECP